MASLNAEEFAYEFGETAETFVETNKSMSDEDIRRQVVLDFFEVELDDVSYVLLCSDGLTNMVDDTIIQEIVMSLEGSVEEKAKKLVTLANENGGKDNISLILIQI